ncbi:hypothetical protein VKT23_010806 [Stygiomarasmius scandens]|uniref:Carboxylic ester hydrolase n=1 Tax=Marasmiellus scandens TaxID=2682957 RepID=A0ABR1JEY5_9AGAR
MITAVFAVALLGFVSSAYCSALGSSNPRVVINNTTFIGQSKSKDVDFFGGIPFAEPPLGNLRLKPPVLKSFLDDSDAGQTIFNATHFGPSCIQTPLPVNNGISEDCLSVNIFKPSSSVINETSSALLPVMLWIYGGGFIIGSSSRYDGTPLVTRSIVRGTPTILVSVNYRMGPLGFPRGDDVAREAEKGSPILNLGSRDNIAALQWIKEHISAFGGDPDKITVFGESAGAFAIELLVLNDQIRGLAKGVILESTGGLPLQSPSSPGSKIAWNNFIAAIPRCQTELNDTVDCMRSLTTSEIIEGYNTAGLFFNTSGEDWLPVIDGEIVPDFPSNLKPRKGVVEAVLIGSNLDEGTLITPQTINSSQSIQDLILSTPPSPPNASPAEREAQLERLETILKQILKLYPNDPPLGSPFGTGNDTFGLNPEYKRYAAVASDLIYQSYRRYMINEQLLKTEIPVFSYLFTDPDAVPVPDFVSGTPAPGSLGVTHSSEIFYVFGDLAVVTPTATDLSNSMMDYWISFANSFTPNDEEDNARGSILHLWSYYVSPMFEPGLLWPGYTQENQVLLQLNGHNTTVIPDNFREEQIAIFNQNQAIFAH